MVNGVTMQIGTTVQQTVVEELRLEAGPAVTLHRLTEEQTARETLTIRDLATQTCVQVLVLVYDNW